MNVRGCDLILICSMYIRYNTAYACISRVFMSFKVTYLYPQSIRVSIFFQTVHNRTGRSFLFTWGYCKQCLNCEKRSGGTLEAGRRRRRDDRRRSENRGAVGTEGEEWGGGVPLPSQLGGLGERRELRLRSPGRSPAEN